MKKLIFFNYAILLGFQVSFAQAKPKIGTDPAIPAPVVTAGTAAIKVNQLAPPEMAIPVIVYGVYRRGGIDKCDYTAGIGDEIVVQVHGLKGLWERANPKAGPKQEIRLYLGGLKFSDLVTLSAPPAGDDGELLFRLERTKDNDKVWTDLLGSPDLNHLFLKNTGISVGIDGFPIETSTVKNFSLVRIRKGWFLPCLFGLALYFLCLIWYAQRRPLLRDSQPDLSSLGLAQPHLPLAPYSLGKVQMAFWFSIVLASYLFIWLITGNYELITNGILGLIGIGAGTALGAVAIDSNKTQDTIKQIQTLQQQQSQINATITSLTTQITTDPTAPGLIAYNTGLNTQISANSTQLIQGLTQKTDGFLNDILTDVNGISFHRLQMFVWTIVLGLIFVYTVWASITMPDFSPTLLSLQGLTAGTYLGFKFPEKQA